MRGRFFSFTAIFCSAFLAAAAQALTVYAETNDGAFAVSVPSEPSDPSYVSVGAREDTEGDIALSFGYGFRDAVKSGRMIPFDLSLENHGTESFKGYFLIEVPGSTEDGVGGSDEALVSYIYDVNIPAGESTRLRDTFSVSEVSDTLRLILYDEDGTVIIEKYTSVSAGTAGVSEILIGILSETPERLDYMHNIVISSSGLRTHTVELDADDLPETVSGYEQLDVLAVSGFDAENLSQDALEAILEWVDGGGALLIGTGNDIAAAEVFGQDIEELILEPEGRREVDMGLKYSGGGPDDAVTTLDICSVFAASGIQTMQSDDVAMLTQVQQGNGVIVIAAYDFSDIADFCAEKMDYTADIIENTLGSVRLSQLSQGQSEADHYRSASDLVNHARPDMMPQISYIALYAGLYMLAVFLVALFLRDRGLSAFFHLFVVMIALLMAAGLFVMTSRLRDYELSLQFAMIREYRDETLQNTGFMRIFAPSGGQHTLKMPAGCEIYPVFGSGSERTSAEETKSGNAVFIYDSDESDLIVIDTSRPFSGALTEFVLRSDADEGAGVEAVLSYDGESAKVHIINESRDRLEDAFLIMYGRMLYLGDIDPGAELSLEDSELDNYPIGASDILAGKIFADTDMHMALSRERLLCYYMDQSLYTHFGGVRLIAFTAGFDALGEVISESRIMQTGSVLLSVEADTDFYDGGYTWINVFENEPRLISGDYDASTNTTSGSCVLEYALGSGLNVTNVRFTMLSEMFESDTLTAFSGTMSVYNYESSDYDYLSGSVKELGPGEIRQYLSPSNTMTVRFVSDGSNGLKLMYLPVPEAVTLENE